MATDPVSIRRITTGFVRNKRQARGVRRYFGDDWSPRALPVNAYLIECSEGLVLFDAGQTAAAARPGYFPNWHPFFRLARFELQQADEVASQLEATGVRHETVGRVVLSHLHTDHVGDLSDFRSAEVIVGETEWRRAQGIRGSLRGYLPNRWPNGLRVRPVEIAGPSFGPFAASYDLLGDERLILVPTPGHTPGHLSMVVRDGETTWLLAGDLAHDPSELERIEPDIARWCAAENVEILTAHDEEATR